MYAMQEMNRISYLILFVMGALLSHAQDNDTALLRSLGVEEVKKGIFIHAFEGKTDTCTFFHRKLDTLARPVWERSDLGCYGFEEVNISEYEYSGIYLSTMHTEQNGDPLSSTYYTYAGPGMPASIKVLFHRTNDSSLAVYNYLGDRPEKPDSNTTMLIDQNGDTSYTKTIARFDDSGRVVEIITIDDERVPVQEVGYEFGDHDKPLSMATSVYGDQPMFIQTYYVYDIEGRLVKSYNSRNQTQLYYYYDNGLLSNIFNYNANGELESEFIFKYTYR